MNWEVQTTEILVYYLRSRYPGSENEIEGVESHFIKRIVFISGLQLIYFILLKLTPVLSKSFLGSNSPKYMLKDLDGEKFYKG